MGTPSRKRFDPTYASPYAKPMEKYPSQCEDFLSLEVGGPQTSQLNRGRSHFSSTPAKHYSEAAPQSEDFLSLDVGGAQSRQHQWNPRRGHYSSTPSKQYSDTAPPPFYQNRQHKQRGRGGYNQFQRGNNRQGFGSNNSGFGGQSAYSNHQQNRKRPYDAVAQHKNGGTNISSYFHSSMLEDPWKDLIERQKALSNSEINMQTRTPPTEEDKDDVESNASEKTLTDKV